MRNVRALRSIPFFAGFLSKDTVHCHVIFAVMVLVIAQTSIAIPCFGYVAFSLSIVSLHRSTAQLSQSEFDNYGLGDVNMF